MKKKILIITDSLGVKSKSNIAPYVWLLKKYFKVYHIGLIGLTSKKALKIINKKNIKCFDYIITHFGIVDCCPRPFNRIISFLLYKFFLTKYIYNLLSKSPFFLKFVNIQWVREKDFKKNVDKLRNVFLKKTRKIIYIAISRPCNFLIKNCGDFSDIVKNYNKAFQRKTRNEIYLNVYNHKNISDYFDNDGVHLNQRGHKMIFTNIKKLIK